MTSKQNQDSYALQLKSEYEKETKQLIEYVGRIYYKGQADTQQKQEILDEIHQIGKDLKQDEDFCYHLYPIYERITKRQQQNLQEFKEYSDIISKQRQDIEKRNEEIMNILDEYTEYQLQNVKTNLKFIDQKQGELEQNIDSANQDLDKHIEQICKTVQISKNDFYNSFSDIQTTVQENKNYIEMEKKAQKDKKDKIIKLKEEQDDLKRQMAETERKLKNLCELMKPEVPAFDQKKINEQINKNNEMLVEQRNKLDRELALKKETLQTVIECNSVVEKRQSCIILDYATNKFKGNQLDQLRGESERMINESNKLSTKIKLTLENTGKINQEITEIRQKKNMVSQINLFLTIIIILISFAILYNIY